MNPALLARLAGRSIALVPRALDGLLVFDPQTRGPMLQLRGEDRDAAGYTLTEHGIAVVSFVGPLLTRGDWLTSLLGAMDYGALGSTMERAFADPSARAVLLELDSPGGEVGGLFDLVDRIGALRESSGKPLWAVAGEAALSAAYAIASAADRLYVTRTAEVGSIGIVAAHVDESGADAMAGRKWTLVHAGAPVPVRPQVAERPDTGCARQHALRARRVGGAPELLRRDYGRVTAARVAGHRGTVGAARCRDRDHSRFGRRTRTAVGGHCAVA